MDEPDPLSDDARDEYRCPGQRFPISRAVHLARLASFYPRCRCCEHRHDTGLLSPRKVQQLVAVAESRPAGSLFREEGVGGVYLNDLTPADARRIAATFATVLRCEGDGPAAGDARREEGKETTPTLLPPSSFISHPFAVVLGGDGRALTAELVAAACEGLRFAGCEVIDVGPVTSACLAFAVQRAHAAGGLLVGNSGTEPHEAAITFWARGGRPISAGPLLTDIRQGLLADSDHRTKVFGDVRLESAAEEYLVAMAGYYHGLRPLRVIVRSSSQPFFHFLRQLADRVACEIVPSRAARQELPDQIRENAAHFAVEVCGNGEACRVWNEQGREVDAGLLLRLLAFRFRPPQTVVVDGEMSGSVVADLEQEGFRVVRSGPSRASLAVVMQANDAALGAGAGGRFWHRDLGLPVPDALMTVTAILILLSRSDAPLSRVLDQLAAGK